MAAGAKSKHFEHDHAGFMMSEPKHRHYLDFNATAPLRADASDVVIAWLGRTGNASSVHAEGRAARAAIETARAEIGALVGMKPEAVTLTAGATESLAIALSPGTRLSGVEAPFERLLIGATEHPAVRRGHRFSEGRVSDLPVDGSGVVDLAALRALLARPGRAIVALQAANGETGVIQPVIEAAALVHAAGGLLVCDAVQAAGRIPCRIDGLGADVLVLSSHKLGGPQGAGALVVANPDLRLVPLTRGGGQERGMRGGTENVAAIAGFGAAARAAADDDGGRLQALRDRLEAGLAAIAPDVVIFGAGAARLPNTCAFAVPGLGNEVALIALDLAGVAVSTGSACSSGKVARSDVLEAMGIEPHLKRGMIRVSLGWSSRIDDVDAFLDAFGAVMRRMRARPARAAA